MLSMWTGPKFFSFGKELSSCNLAWVLFSVLHYLPWYNCSSPLDETVLKWATSCNH